MKLLHQLLSEFSVGRVSGRGGDPFVVYDDSLDRVFRPYLGKVPGRSYIKTLHLTTTMPLNYSKWDTLEVTI